MSASDGYFGSQSSHHHSPDEHPAGWVGGAPTTASGQSCAICATSDVRWVHRLDPDLVTYCVYGKGHTLPGFWCLCARCEDLYRAGNDAALIELMNSDPDWFCESDSDQDLGERTRKPLAVFRRADCGARPLATD